MYILIKLFLIKIWILYKGEYILRGLSYFIDFIDDIIYFLFLVEGLNKVIIGWIIVSNIMIMLVYEWVLVFWYIIKNIIRDVVKESFFFLM